MRAIAEMLYSKRGGASGAVLGQMRRWMVGKAANRASVHGSKLPVPDTVLKDEVETEITKAIGKNEKKRRGIENAVDSQLKNWQVLYLEDLICSK